MDINATLFGQMITFAVFVWFTMKFIWPHITQAMSEREKKIADGIAAADKAQRELELAHTKAADHIRESKSQAAEIVDQANQRVNRMIDDAKEQARQEGEVIVASANQEIDNQRQKAVNELKSHTAELAITVAEKVLGKQIDKKTQASLVDEIISKV